jgi:hypothetical protein
MDRFFNDQNLDRLRSLASIATTEAERKILLGLLAEESLKFIELAEGQNGSAWLKLTRSDKARFKLAAIVEPPDESAGT